MLGAFNIKYLPRTAVKVQVLTDLVEEFTKEQEQVGSEEVEVHEEGLRVNAVSSQQTWQFFVAGQLNKRARGLE